MFTQLINRLNQRRELNRWLKEKRRYRYIAGELSEHLRRDIGLDQQSVEPPLTWQEPKQQPEEKRKPGKERAGPDSA